MHDIYRQFARDEVIDSDSYGQHIVHLTKESLRAKSEIAAELAYRDLKIAELEVASETFNAVIGYVLEQFDEQDAMLFLRHWYEGNFEALKEWDDAPDIVFSADASRTGGE